MGFWRRLFGGDGSSGDDLKPQRLDYLNEALALERQGDYDAALTSYRLALRDHPNDARILQNMAIAFTKTRRFDEAIRHYRRALELDSSLAGAHYGLAFLLLQRGDPDGAAQHLKTFLAHPPRGPDAQKWIEHATQALHDLRSGEGGGGGRHRACERSRREDRQPLIRTVARLAVLLAGLGGLSGCKVSTNLDQVVALEIVLPNGGQLEVGDTLLPSARALNGHGDTVTSPIFWVTLDTAIITVLDSTTGATLGDTIGLGRLQARVGLLISNPQTVTVITHLDSVTVTANSPTRDTITVSQPDTISDSLQVQLYATPAVAAGRRVVFSATTFPASSPFVTLVPRDTIFSSFTGLAAAQVKIVAGGTVPDSVVVTATVQRPDGTPIPGSPVTFVVEFRP